MTEAPPPAPLPSEPARQGVRSVETGLALLTALAEAGRPMALADLARAAGMAPAKAHRYLVSLIRAGMAERREPGSRYDLGPAALSLGLAALGRLDRQGLTEAALVELRDALDETVCVAAWANRGPTILRMEAGEPVGRRQRPDRQRAVAAALRLRAGVRRLARRGAGRSGDGRRSGVPGMDRSGAGASGRGCPRRRHRPGRGGAAARRECGLGTGLRPRRPGGFRADGAGSLRGLRQRTGRPHGAGPGGGGAAAVRPVRPYPRDSRSAVGTRTEGGPRNRGIAPIDVMPAHLAYCRCSITPIRPLPAPPGFAIPSARPFPGGSADAAERLASATSSNGRTAIGR